MGSFILLMLSVIQVVITPIYDLNSAHLGNPKWPAHAKFHCVAYTLLNMGLGLACGFLVIFGPRPFGPHLASLMLAWAALAQFIAVLFPGVSPAAEGEQIWRGLPVSHWGSAVYFILAILGGALI